MYSCRVCGSFASPTFAAVMRHIGSTHAADEQLVLVCPVQGCTREDPYSNFESFRSHVYRKHRGVLRGLSVVNAEGYNSCQVTAEDTSGTEAIDYEDVLESGEADCSLEDVETLPSDGDMQSDAARFLLKTREERKITQSAVDGVVKDVTELWDKAMKQVHCTRMCMLVECCIKYCLLIARMFYSGVIQKRMKLEEKLAESPEALVAVRSVFDEGSLFAGIETYHKQQKFYRERFGLLVSDTPD